MNNGVLSSTCQCVGLGKMKEWQNFDNRHSREMNTWKFIMPFLLLFVSLIIFLIKLDNCPFSQERKLDLTDAFITRASSAFKLDPGY